MKINEVILNEKLSSILYHDTDLSSIYSILEKDSFILTPTFVSSSEEEYKSKRKKMYFMSFSRSKSFSYRKEFMDSVLLVIDGDKLNQKFSGKPVDYFSTMPTLKRSEKEDRLFHTEPTIENASKYIKEIHILVKAKWETEIPDKNIRKILQTNLMAKKKNIPFYIYDDAKSFSNLNSEESISIKELPKPTKDQDIKNSYFMRKSRSLDEIFELLNKSSYDKLSNKAKDKLDEMSGFYRNETIESIKASIHTISKIKKHRNVIDRLIKEMKKKKLYSIEELVDHLVDKFDQQ